MFDAERIKCVADVTRAQAAATTGNPSTPGAGGGKNRRRLRFRSGKACRDAAGGWLTSL
ncbi:MAG: hypothetical protein H5U13_09030 [Parvibaculum sp.]|nr:hypothetical protein [Parvibaculum sp.]